MEAQPMFTPEQLSTIVRMCAALGELIVITMLHALNPESRILLVEGFGYFCNAEGGSLSATISKLEETNSTMAAAGIALQQSLQASLATSTKLKEELDATRAQSPSHAHTRVKLEATKYGGGESEKLLRWILQVTAAADGQGITHDPTRVAFAISHLKDRAKEWAYGQRLINPACFPSFADFIADLKANFAPPNAGFRHRASLLSAKQGKKSLRDFIHEIRYLLACLSDDNAIPRLPG